MKYRAVRAAWVLVIVVTCSMAAAAADKKPSVTLKRVAVAGVNWMSQTARTTVSVEVHNPGPAFKIKELRYKLKLNGTEVADGEHRTEIQIPAESSAIIDVPLTVKLLAIPGVTWSTISQGLTLRYDLDTEFTVPIFAFIKKDVKTSFSGDLAIGQMLSELGSTLKDRVVTKP